MTEIWKPVVGFEGRYEVSDQGRVRSLLFRSNMPAEIMTTTPNYAGYHVVTLGAARKQKRVHCLVLEAFVGSRPPGMQGCHGDNDRDHNALSNLRWDTPKGNIADRASYVGDRNPNARITNEQKQEIIELRKKGAPGGQVAEKFGITDTRVRQIMKEVA